jgi:ligand-binding sensor domain-containing protein
MRPLARKVPLALLALLSLPGVATPSWRRSGPDGGMVRTIAVDVAHAGTLYAATGSGVFKTTDGGEGWTGASAGLPSEDVGDLAIDPLTPATLWAATRAGLAKSTDAAESWTGAP